ncbi:21707_t:CDS:2, partial [Cetraspora pellucida]
LSSMKEVNETVKTISKAFGKSDVKGTLKIKPLSDGLKEFINEHVETGDAALLAYNK